MEPGAQAYKVRVQDHGAVRVLVLDRPGKLNAFTPAGYIALREQLLRCECDENVSVCVLTGRGRAFSAGVDLNEVTKPLGKEELGVAFDPLLECLASFSKPLIAAVNGLAVGFGATLLLHCDIVLVDESTVIKLPFVSLGTSAEAASSWLLAQRVGAQNASWLVLSGKPLDAHQAVQIGFAWAKSRTGQVLHDALSAATKIAGHNLKALVANKGLLRGNDYSQRVAETWLHEKQVMLELAEQVESFGWPGVNEAAQPDLSPREKAEEA